MIRVIKENPFLSLGITSLLLSAVVLDATGNLNPIVVFFGLYGVFLIFLNFVRVDKKLSYEKIDRKLVKMIISTSLEEEKELEEEKRRAVFLGLGKTILKPEDLRKMSYEDDEFFKSFIAVHPQTPADVLLEYSLDSSDKGVLAAIASNPKTSTSVADRIKYELLEDLSSEEAQRKILNDPTSSETLLKQVFLKPFNTEEVNRLLISHPNISDELFNEITVSGDTEILTAIASSKKVINNSDLVLKLKQWISYDIMFALLSNPNINRRTLELYDGFNHDRANLQEIIKERDKLPLATLAWIGRSAPIYKNVMAELIKSKSPDHQNMPYDDIMKTL